MKVPTAGEILLEVRRILPRIEAKERPPLKSIALHPDDFQVLRDHVAVNEEHDFDSDVMFGPLRIRGVPIYWSEDVPRGKLRYDPPEAGPEAKVTDASKAR